jgi:hypothetical protein
MIPLAILTAAGSTAIFIKAKNLSIRINELLEVEQAYYRLLEEAGPNATGVDPSTKSCNFHGFSHKG